MDDWTLIENTGEAEFRRALETSDTSAAMNLLAQKRATIACVKMVVLHESDPHMSVLHHLCQNNVFALLVHKYAHDESLPQMAVNIADIFGFRELAAKSLQKAIRKFNYVMGFVFSGANVLTFKNATNDTFSLANDLHLNMKQAELKLNFKSKNDVDFMLYVYKGKLPCVDVSKVNMTPVVSCDVYQLRTGTQDASRGCFYTKRINLADVEQTMLMRVLSNKTAMYYLEQFCSCSVEVVAYVIEKNLRCNHVRLQICGCGHISSCEKCKNAFYAFHIIPSREFLQSKIATQAHIWMARAVGNDALANWFMEHIV